MTSSTISLPDPLKPAAAVLPASVVGLRLAGTRVEYSLDPSRLWWMLGSGERCDIQIAGDPHVSAVHAFLLRQADGAIQLTDKSKNGTFVGGVRTSVGIVHDGAVIQVGASSLIAFSDASRAALLPRERLVGTMPGFVAARDTALAAARCRTHQVLLGEAGTGKATLGRAIHQESAAAAGPCVELDGATFDPAAQQRALLLTRQAAAGGTVLVRRAHLLGDEARAGLATTLVAASAVPAPDTPFVRFIVTAEPGPWLESAVWLGALEASVVVTLPPLRERVLDVAALAGLFARELLAGKAVTFPPAEVAALAGLDWPGNAAELRAAVRAAVACARPGNEGSFAALWPATAELDVALRRGLERAIAAAPSRRAAAEGLGLAWGTFRRLQQRCSL